MSTVAEVKAATARLKPQERWELFKWMAESEDMRRYQWEDLRREIALGIAEADQGEVAPLDAEAIIAQGRARRAAKLRA